MEENKFEEILNNEDTSTSQSRSIDEANEILKQAQETLNASKEAIKKAEAESKNRPIDVEVNEEIAEENETIESEQSDDSTEEANEIEENESQESNETEAIDVEETFEKLQEDNSADSTENEEQAPIEEEAADQKPLSDETDEVWYEDLHKEGSQPVEEDSNEESIEVSEEKPNKKSKILIIIVAICILLGLGGYVAYRNFNNKPQEEIVEPIEEVVEEPIHDPQPERQLWLDNKAINEDYIGEIVFDSGLIDKSFVQAEDVYDKNGDLYHFYTEYGDLVTDPTGYTGNDVYIWTNWKEMTWDYNILGGSVFMDYRNVLDDQNLIIYGHHFSVGGGNDPERIKAFTPLELLLKEENFKGNEKVRLILDNETRTYQIAYIYIFDVTDEDYLNNAQYWRTNYDYEEYSGAIEDNYYIKYIDFIKEHSLYDTGLDLTPEDNTLTLQTCIGGSTTEFEIIVLKELEVKEYTD